MKVSIKELKGRGWEVLKHWNGSFKIRNGEWDHIHGFASEEHAWGWLSKVGEPRTPRQIDPRPVMWIG
jgi:hypothetical protein